MEGLTAPIPPLEERESIEQRVARTLRELIVAGIVVSMVLKAVFLGILGGPIASLSWLAVVVGVGLFFWGYTKIRDARSA